MTSDATFSTFNFSAFGEFPEAANYTTLSGIVSYGHNGTTHVAGTLYHSAGEEDEVSAQTLETVSVIVYGVFGVIICSFGVCANIINIVIFAKQGFAENVNVSLFAMAISDLLSVVPLLWVGICSNPLFKRASLPFFTESFAFISGEWPHVFGTRITSWLTTLVTLERCLCVTLPLKVKSILTLNRIKGIVVAIYVFTIVPLIPLYFYTHFAPEFFKEYNRSMLTYTFAPASSKAAYERISVFIHSTIPTTIHFLVVSISTVILVKHLRKQSKWRQQTAAHGTTSTKADHQNGSTNDGVKENPSNSMASKEKRVVKMVTFVAAIFITCFFPHMIAMMTTSFDPEFNVMGKRKNTYRTVGCFVLTLEALNSSVNIFVYYRMSSKYRSIFRKTFLRLGDEEKS